VTGFEALVRDHQAAVCATAFSVLRDRGRSEEIAQDAFLIAWRRLPELTPQPPLPAWICGIARNLARNAARKHREAPMTESIREPAAATTPLDSALSREQLDISNRALATLRDEDREVVVLYYRGEESIASVAAALEVSEPTAQKRLSRARERLRSAIASVEASLRATRPGPAFTVACIAALAAGRIPEAAAATAIPAAKPVVPIAIGAAVLAVVGGLAIREAVSSSPPSSAATTTSASPSLASSAPAASTAAPGTARSSSTGGFLGRIGPAERAALIERVRATRAAANEEPKVKIYDFADTNLADVALPDPMPTGPLRKTTLRYAIKLIHPLLLACRTDESAHGRLAVRMRLAGEESGTVVEAVEITGDPPLSDDADLVECVRTTLESLELPAMNDVAPWDVHYPFIL
jgi:RNA polymerase sigma factor (sigma-70 family)